MARLINIASKIWIFLKKPFVIMASVGIVFLYGVYLFSYDRIAGDAASHLLLAVSPILELGSPYKDFWEIKPPAWPMVLYGWSLLFGFKLASIRILNLVVASFVVIACRLIYKKIFVSPISEIFFVFTAAITLSPILYSNMFLPTELLGLMFSMLAIVLLMYVKNDFGKFYFAGLFFLLASQTKEPFTFTVFAILPVLFEVFLRHGFYSFIKGSVKFLAGILSGVGVLYFYLLSFGSVSAYRQIVQYKQRAFPFTYERLMKNFVPGFEAMERTFTEFSYGLLFVCLFAGLVFILANKFSKNIKYNQKLKRLETESFVVLDGKNLYKFSALFYALGSLLGFGLGGSFGQHYLIQTVFPFYVLYGLIASFIFNRVAFLYTKPKPYLILAVMLLVVVILISAPKRQYFLSYLPYINLNRNFVMHDDIAKFETRISELTENSQCVLSVYGWGASENYLYSRRKPCTRFFLANMVREDWQKKEYLDSILANPPAAIYYRTNASDMDVGKFETEVINIKRIVDECYVKDVEVPVVYIPKTKDDTGELKKCVRESSGVDD